MRWGVALAFLLLALSQVGLGPLNGDAAIYAAQGVWGDWVSRPVHLGWIGPAVVLGHLGVPVGLGLDVLHVGLAAWLVQDLGRDHAQGVWVSLLAAGLLLPVAPFAEVDLPWALGWWLAITRPGPPAAVAMAWAVSVSPTALLALPAAMALRAEHRWAPAIGALLAVGLLSAVDGGRWWWGGRGVWTTSGALGLAGLGALVWPATLALGWLGRQGLASTIWLLLPLLAPADVAAWLPLTLWLCSKARVASRLDGALVAAVVLLGLGGLAWRSSMVRTEHAQILAQAAVTAPDAEVEVDSWREGVQLSIALTGHPYGLRWRLRSPPS